MQLFTISSDLTVFPQLASKGFFLLGVSTGKKTLCGMLPPFLLHHDRGQRASEGLSRIRVLVVISVSLNSGWCSCYVPILQVYFWSLLSILIFFTMALEETHLPEAQSGTIKNALNLLVSCIFLCLHSLCLILKKRKIHRIPESAAHRNPSKS